MLINREEELSWANIMIGFSSLSINLLISGDNKKNDISRTVIKRIIPSNAIIQLLISLRRLSFLYNNHAEDIAIIRQNNKNHIGYWVISFNLKAEYNLII